MLRDGSNSGSVVGACVDRRHSVDTSREAIRNVSTKDAADGGIVQTLEEGEVEGVEDLRRFKGRHLLDNNAVGSDAHQVSSVFQFDAKWDMSYWECATKVFPLSC